MASLPWSLESCAQVEWASISEEGVDTVIAYAATPDHDIDAYQSSRVVRSDLATSTEVGGTGTGTFNAATRVKAYSSKYPAFVLSLEARWNITAMEMR